MIDCSCRWEGGGIGGGNAPVINIPDWWNPSSGVGDAPSIDIPSVSELTTFFDENKRHSKTCNFLLSVVDITGTKAR